MFAHIKAFHEAMAQECRRMSLFGNQEAWRAYLCHAQWARN